MTVQYINGQFYNNSDANDPIRNAIFLQEVNKGFVQPINAPVMSSQSNNGLNQSMFGNPFGSAMSGVQSGTLQPYVNRMTQNASNALYGGLLNYQPQSMIAGNAGGTPQNSTVPQGFNLPSALQGMMGGQGLNFGNRSWMKQGGQ